MHWILKPIDDSLDQILICDNHDTVLGALHVDAFNTPDTGIYERLWNGKVVEVEVSMIPE